MKFNKKKILSNIISVVVLLVASAGVIYAGSVIVPERASYIKTHIKHDLYMRAGFSGAMLTITNKDDFEWKNVKIEINRGPVSEGYTVKVELIQPGETRSIPALQFAKPDGRRLDIFQMKPQTIIVSCETRSGCGFHTRSWE
jgi:hypothetical protein